MSTKLTECTAALAKHFVRQMIKRILTRNETRVLNGYFEDYKLSYSNYSYLSFNKTQRRRYSNGKLNIAWLSKCNMQR